MELPVLAIWLLIATSFAIPLPLPRSDEVTPNSDGDQLSTSGSANDDKPVGQITEPPKKEESGGEELETSELTNSHKTEFPTSDDEISSPVKKTVGVIVNSEIESNDNVDNPQKAAVEAEEVVKSTPKTATDDVDSDEKDDEDLQSVSEKAKPSEDKGDTDIHKPKNVVTHVAPTEESTALAVVKSFTLEQNKDNNKPLVTEKPKYIPWYISHREGSKEITSLEKLIDSFEKYLEDGKGKEADSKAWTQVAHASPIPDAGTRRLGESKPPKAKESVTLFPHKYYILNNDIVTPVFGGQGIRYGPSPRFSSDFANQQKSVFPPPLFSSRITNQPKSMFPFSPSFSSLFTNQPKSLFPPPSFSPLSHQLLRSVAKNQGAGKSTSKRNFDLGLKAISEKREGAGIISAEKNMSKLLRKIAQQQFEIKKLVLQLANSQSAMRKTVKRIEYQVKNIQEDGIDADSSSWEDATDHETSAKTYRFTIPI